MSFNECNLGMEKLGNFMVLSKNSTCHNNINILLVHGFGASKNIGEIIKIFLAKFLIAAIDLLGFGESSQPRALLNYEPYEENSLNIPLIYGVIKYQHFV